LKECGLEDTKIDMFNKIGFDIIQGSSPEDVVKNLLTHNQDDIIQER